VLSNGKEARRAICFAARVPALHLMFSKDLHEVSFTVLDAQSSQRLHLSRTCGIVPEMDKFIYLLSDPSTGLVRWVGATNNPKQRFNEHCCKTDNVEKAAWISDLKSRGLKPEMEVLSETPIAEWEEEEIFLIMYLRFLGANLLNKDGGGVLGRTKRTLETRKRMSLASTGKVASAETREKMSAAKIGSTHTLETRMKIKNANTGKTASLETRLKIGASSAGRVCSDETRAKMSKVRAGRPISAESLAKMMDGRKKYIAAKTAAKKAADSALNILAFN
jgi:hypothetical protein